MTPPIKRERRGAWRSASCEEAAARELARIVRDGRRKHGQVVTRGPLTRGERFQRWRIRAGATLGDLALAGVPSDDLQRIARFERGQDEPTEREIRGLQVIVLPYRDRRTTAESQEDLA